MDSLASVVRFVQDWYSCFESALSSHVSHRAPKANGWLFGRVMNNGCLAPFSPHSMKQRINDTLIIYGGKSMG